MGPTDGGEPLGAHDGGASDCTIEVAAGYPKLGASGCRTHQVFNVNGFANDESSAKGMIETGYGLGTLSTENLTLTTPLGQRDYTAADCIQSVVEFGGQTFASTNAYDANAKRLTVSLHRSGDVVWGDFDGDLCRLAGYINVGGTVTPNYKCRGAIGKFAARIDAPRCQTACAGDVKPVGRRCQLPSCSTRALCELTWCPINSQTCLEALPAPDGHYQTQRQVGELTLISLTFAQGKLASLRVDRQPPFAPLESETVSFAPPKELLREVGGYVVDEDLRSDGGTPRRLRMNVIEDQLADGGSALTARSASFSADSVDYFGELVLPKVP